MNDDYNYKVIAELRGDLSDSERQFIGEKIESLKQKMDIVKVGSDTYCKAQPIVNYNDFGPVGFFFVELGEFKEYFSKLEYYNMWRGEVDVAV